MKLSGRLFLCPASALKQKTRMQISWHVRRSDTCTVKAGFRVQAGTDGLLLHGFSCYQQCSAAQTSGSVRAVSLVQPPGVSLLAGPASFLLAVECVLSSANLKTIEPV